MKITMLIDMANLQSNGKLIAEELKRQGHTVQKLNRLYLPGIEEIAAFNPEVVIGTHTHKFMSPEITRQIKNIPSRPLMVLWYCDGYSPLGPEAREKFKATSGLYDLTLVAVRGLVNDFKAIGYSPSVVWTPQYFDDTFFKPTIERIDVYDVCFLGNVYPTAQHRLEFIDALEKRFKVLKGGNGLGDYYYGQACANFYMRSKMAIDIPSRLPRTELLMSDRIYRAMGLGCLFISQSVIGLGRMFIPGIHLDTYNNSIDGLCEKIEYFLKHPERRKEIAAKGQREILAKHTIGIRVKEYMAAIDEARRDRDG